MGNLDPVTVAVFRDRIVSTAKQMASYVENASPSFVTAEVHDLSTAIFDKQGRPNKARAGSALSFRCA